VGPRMVALPKHGEWGFNNVGIFLVTYGYNLMFPLVEACLVHRIMRRQERSEISPDKRELAASQAYPIPQSLVPSID